MRAGLCLLIIAVAAPAAYAGDESHYRIFAKPVERPAPRYPVHELRRNQQGWVVLNFVVTDDGRVVEPVVEASSGARAFEDAAMNTVKSWRYEPARLNGQPVQQCKTRVRIAFATQGAQDKVSRQFYGRYRRMEKDLDEGDIESASAELETVLQSEGLTLAEMSWLWALKARIAGMRGNKEQQLEAVRHATAGSSQWVTEDLLTGLLATKTALELETGDLSAAMLSYQELKSIGSSDTSQLDPSIEQVNALVESDDLFFADARIGDNPNCETCASVLVLMPTRSTCWSPVVATRRR